jgi:hypothetical protein
MTAAEKDVYDVAGDSFMTLLDKKNNLHIHHSSIFLPNDDNNNHNAAFSVHR